MRKNKSQKSFDEPFEEFGQSIHHQKLRIAKDGNPFRPFVHEKDILFNCIDRSLRLLPDMYVQCNDVDAERITAIASAIEKLIGIRKQFIIDYWAKPFVKQEADHD